MKNVGIMTTSPDGEHPKGRELGSVARAAKPFLVKDILFSVLSNHIPGCVASINIFLKSSYLRETALGEMKPLPANIGIAVKGLEYQ